MKQIAKNFLVPFVIVIGTFYVYSIYENAGGEGSKFPDVVEISVSDAYEAYIDNNVIFVDARSSEFFQKEHITNAISLPYETRVTWTWEQIPNPQNIGYLITYCDGEICSLGITQARYMSEDLGINPIYHLTGGIYSWIATGYPITRGES